MFNHRTSKRAVLSTALSITAALSVGAECAAPRFALEQPLAVHNGTAWKTVTAGQHVVVFRDNPPMGGTVSFTEDGLIRGHNPRTDGLPDLRAFTSGGASILNNFVFEQTQFRIHGESLQFHRDAVNDGDLGVGPWGPVQSYANQVGLERFPWRSGGLQLAPGRSTPIRLERRYRTGDPYKGYAWAWQELSSGSVELHPRVRVVNVVVGVLNIDGITTDGGGRTQRVREPIIDPADTRGFHECSLRPTPECLRNRFDARDAQAWFDGRSIDNRLTTVSSGGHLGAAMFDRDVRSRFSYEEADASPRFGRDIRAQDPDTVFAQCARYGNDVVQFRLHTFVERPIVNEDRQVQCRPWPLDRPLSGNNWQCIADAASVLRTRARVSRDTLVIIVADQYAAGNGEAALNDPSAIVSLRGFQAGGWHTVAHEIGHVLGLDHVPLSANLMFPVSGAFDPQLDAAQCATVYQRAAGLSQWQGQ